MSLFRIVATPFILIFWLVLDWTVAGMILGTIVGITDLADGWVARKLNQTTELGGMIDQLGDLIFESFCLLLTVAVGELWMGALCIYLFREFTVMVVRSFVVSKGGTLPSNTLGKAKTSFIQWAFFLIFLSVILLEPGVVPESWTMVGIHPGRIIIWVAWASITTGLTLGLISAFIYLKAFANFYVDYREGELR